MSLIGHQVMSSTEPSACWSPVEFNPAPKLRPGILITPLFHIRLGAFQASSHMWVPSIRHEQASSYLGSLIKVSELQVYRNLGLNKNFYC